MQRLAINDKHILVVYLPENTQYERNFFQCPFTYSGSFVDSNGLMYFLDNLIFPDGMTGIGDCTFEDRHSLSSITIPDSVTEIGEGAFAGCSSLTSITVPNGIT